MTEMSTSSPPIMHLRGDFDEEINHNMNNIKTEPGISQFCTCPRQNNTVFPNQDLPLFANFQSSPSKETFQIKLELPFDESDVPVDYSTSRNEMTENTDDGTR